VIVGLIGGAGFLVVVALVARWLGPVFDRINRYIVPSDAYDAPVDLDEELFLLLNREKG